MQIRPQEPFPLVYLLTDPNDTGTYYVRAVMRNSTTGAVVPINGQNFVNLTVSPSNSRRFTNLIAAPTDQSGSGFWIDITTTVYTDAAYTVKSDAYQEQFERYLVAELWSVALGSGGSGFSGGDSGGGVDYDKLKELFLEIITGWEMPQPEVVVDLTPIIDGQDALSAAIGSIKLPEYQKVDMEAHGKQIVVKLVEALKANKVDLTPILDRIGEIEIPEQVSVDEIVEKIEPHFTKIHKKVDALKEGFSSKAHLSVLGDMLKSAADMPEKPIGAARMTTTDRARRLIHLR